MIHRGTLSVEGNADDPNGLVWRDQHGRLLDNTGTPIPPTALPEPANHYRPPCGERLDMNWIGWEHPTVTTRRHHMARQLDQSSNRSN